jgi:hypothetical protein
MEEGEGGLSRREINSLLNGKKRLSSKDFLGLQDLIWKGTAPVKYQDPDRWRARA